MEDFIYDNTKQEFKFEIQRSAPKTISDTLVFLKMYGKDLFRKSWKILFPYIILLVLSQYYYSYSLNNFRIGTFKITWFLLVYILHFIVMIIFSSLMQSVIISYIKALTNNATVSAKELKNMTYDYFFKVLLINFLLYFIIGIATIFFIIPGIYLLVALSFTSILIILKEIKPVKSLKESFDLTKGYWWYVFGIIILNTLIMLLMSFAFQGLSYLYLTFKGLFGESSISNMFLNTSNDPVLMTIYIISVLSYALLNGFFIISLTLGYFNILESKTHSSIIKEIDTIGDDIGI